MSDYRRHRVPGGTYFFTVNLLDRITTLLVDQVDILHEAIREARKRNPYRFFV